MNLDVSNIEINGSDTYCHLEVESCTIFPRQVSSGIVPNISHRTIASKAARTGLFTCAAARTGLLNLTKWIAFANMYIQGSVETFSV